VEPLHRRQVGAGRLQTQRRPTLDRIDVPALLKAAESGFPSWVSVQVNVRNTVVFAGAVLALIATATA
jgi:hypothetical protein